MPAGAAPRALLSLLALIITLAVSFGPVVEARPKDKNKNNQDEVPAETVPASDPGQTDAVYVEDAAPVVEQPLTTNSVSGGSNDRTLLELDADGDYIPDALDNCPNVQNPDQADSDGDGNGDSCVVYQDTDGDTVPDKQDNCPNIATSDFSDRDGDGVGDSCDKSPDGIEPEPEPVPEYSGEGGEGETEAPAPENGENLNGKEVERDGRSRSKQRDRTDISKPVITTGSDPEAEGVGGPPAQEEPPLEEPARDNPRRNEELIAEAAASGELYAPPEPPPAPQRAWDEESISDSGEWESILKVDAGATDDAELATQLLADDEPNDAGSRNAGGDRGDQEPPDQPDNEVEDSQFARGWVRAKLLLQGELQVDAPGADSEAADDEATDSEPIEPETSETGRREGSAPVPVENGLVITSTRNIDDPPRTRDRAAEEGDAGEEAEPLDVDDSEPLDEEIEALDDEPVTRDDRQEDKTKDAIDRDESSSRKDGSRRDGSSRGAAAVASEREEANAGADEKRQDTPEKKRRNRHDGGDGVPTGWSDDRYFEGGSALDWSGSFDVAGTDDGGLYLTQRSGSGPGKRRGFTYAIPLDGSGVYMVRLYFAEPYWGSPGGPDGDAGQRVFSVTAEGETLLEDLDVYAEVGNLTALIKQSEVDVQDGVLDLSFIASEGEPIVAAIEILQPSS